MGFPAGGGIVHIEMKELEEAGSVRLSPLGVSLELAGDWSEGHGAPMHFWVDDHGPVCHVLTCVDLGHLWPILWPTW